METTDKIIEFAPYVIVVLMFFWQNNVFVRPADLEKKHREILKDARAIIDAEIKGKYVEINAYKEFQNHIYSKLDELNAGINELKSALMNRRKND